MTGLESASPRVDGRSERRRRNIDAVLDVVVDMFAEESLVPTIEQVATRSGLSLRSLYRYFADPSELLEAAITRSHERHEGIAHLQPIGRGPLSARIDDFTAMRMRVYNAAGSVYRATLANAPHNSRIRDELTRSRNDFRAQFERQFAPELQERKPAARKAVIAAGDVLTQLDSIDFLRRHRQLSVAETEAVLRSALHALLS